MTATSVHADLHVREVVSQGGAEGLQHTRGDGRRAGLSGQEVRHQAGLDSISLTIGCDVT